MSESKEYFVVTAQVKFLATECNDKLDQVYVKLISKEVLKAFFAGYADEDKSLKVEKVTLP